MNEQTRTFWVTDKTAMKCMPAHVALDDKGRPWKYHYIDKGKVTNDVLNQASSKETLEFPADFDGVKPDVTHVTEETIDEAAANLKDNIDKLLATINSYVYQYEQQEAERG